MRWPLRNQILLPFAGLTLAAIVAVSTLAAALAAQRAKSQIEGQLRSIVATLSDSTFPLTDAVLEQMSGLSGADFFFFEPDGRLHSASRSVQLLPSVPAGWAVRSDRPVFGPSVNIGNERYFEMMSWIDGRGTRGPGWLMILYPERIWREARSAAVLPPLAVGGVALVGTAVAAFLLAGRFARPILELRRQVNRIAEADFSPMRLPERNDELRDLAAATNRLADRLAEMDRVIRRSERLALLGQLAGGLAHQLRNSVTGARMAVELHARGCNVDQESLDVALRQLTLTEENLKQFLAGPSINQRTKIERTPCQLKEIVRGAVALLEPSLRHRRVSITEADCRGTQPLTLLADRGLLRQLLVNLLLNAADAAGPSGSVRLEMESQCARSANSTDSADFAVLRVIDNGPGLSADIAGRLFEPFATTKPEGVGLGLAVAQQIAHAHDGQIVFSRRNGETCCEVHLPLGRTVATCT